MVYFSKERDYTLENTISQSIIIGDHKKYVKNKHMIFIDDMADTCGTLCKTIELLKESFLKKLHHYLTQILLLQNKAQIKL